MRDKIFYTMSFGFLLGTLMRSFIFLDWFFIFFGLLLGSIFLIYTFFFHQRRQEIFKHIFLLGAFFIFAFIFSVIRFNFYDTLPPDFLYQKVGEKVSLSGVVVDEPDVRSTNQKLLVRLDAQNFKTEDFDEVNVLISVGLDKYFKYGDLVSFSGKLLLPESFETQEGRVFNYPAYLRKDKIFFLMHYPFIKTIGEGEGNFLKKNLFTIKENFLEKINTTIPPPASTLLGGLILGERSSFSQELRQQFIDTGTIHIVALSGYNVTIIADWIIKGFAWLPSNIAFTFGISGIFLFVLMTGGQATALRAGIMASLAILAKASGKTYDVFRGIVFVAVVMVFINPFVLVYDVSFQLSFLATIAVIFFTPVVQKYFFWIKNKWWQDMVATTFSAYLFVLPFVAYNMGNISLVALPTNILVLPLIPLIMIMGFISGILGFVSNMLMFPLSQLVFLLLSWQLFVIDFMANIPLSSFSLKEFNLWIVILIYSIFVWMILKKF